MSNNSGNSEVKLRRVLTLSDLVIYGIILIQPVAALPLLHKAPLLVGQSGSPSTLIILPSFT